jgi:glutaconate CoA-transferase subunit B
VPKLDFITAQGNVDRVVTPLCVFRRRNGMLAVESIHPGVSPDQLVSATGFAIDADESTLVTPSPTAEEIATLAAVDPNGVSFSEF